MSNLIDPYYARKDDGGTRFAGLLFLVIVSLVIAMVIMQMARSCDREPVPVVIGVNNMRCSFCHYERVALLDNNKKYKAHHQKKRAMGFNDADENEYLARLIAGGQP